MIMMIKKERRCNFMRNKMRKDYQQHFTKKLRELNKACEEDFLWFGRFVVRQLRSDWYQFEDNSGGILYIILRAYDKKTDYYRDYRIAYTKNRQTINWILSMEIMNTFIIEDLKVWEKENPREEIKDWRKTSVPEDLARRPLNFYMGRLE
jgi:hypothetical protein